MNIEPKSREQKLVDAMFAYFGDMNAEVDEDPQTQRNCSHLLTLGDKVMGNHFTLSFIDLWNSEYPEEEEVTSHEVHWTLKIFDTSMTQRMPEQRQVPLDANSTRSKFRFINGGLSAKPDRPYVAPEDIVHDYDLDS